MTQNGLRMKYSQLFMRTPDFFSFCNCNGDEGKGIRNRHKNGRVDRG